MRFEEMLGGEIGWDDTIMEVPGSALEELGKLVVDWLAENADFNAWGLKNVVEHTVTVPEPERFAEVADA